MEAGENMQQPPPSQQYPSQQYPPHSGNELPSMYPPQPQPVQGGYIHPPIGHPAQPIAMQPFSMQQYHPQQQQQQQLLQQQYQQQYGTVSVQPHGIYNQMGPGNAEVWMALPPVIPPNCPPGLEYMTQIDQLLVKQQMDLLEIVSGFEMNNKYKIKNSLGQNVYYAIEDTDCFTRQCGPMRAFNIKIYDNANNEVMNLHRPFRCDNCCAPCFLQEIEVTSPPGTVIGYVMQKWTLGTPSFSPKFEVCNAQREAVLLIEGPALVISCFSDIEFKVVSLDGVSQVGKVTKQWGGFIKEAFTDADTFGISFPMDLDVEAKATMLGAVMLIDFMYFEQNPNQNQNNRHHNQLHY